jgi:carboxypeptidase C (cathepsin A)
MKKRSCLNVLVAVLILFQVVAAGPALAQRPTPGGTPAAEAPAPPPPAPSVTDHSIQLGGATLDYTATAGFEQIRDDNGQAQANMFYVAYTKKGELDPAKRPVTFVFNGGPGSAAIWLHLGAVGPKRVLLADDGMPLSPPPQWVDNESTWLDVTDLVCIDPVGTGFSQAAPGVDANKFYEVRQDARSIAEFIRLYVTANHRWLSPKLIAGESYGGTRAPLVARLLQTDYGTDVSGLVLISPVIDFETFSAQLRGHGTDLAYAVSVPSYATTAWYHKKLAPDLQADFQGLVRQVEEWSIQTYLPALVQGDALPPDDQATIARQLSRYTGISESFIKLNRLRMTPSDFRRELLRDQGLEISQYDTRFTFSSGRGGQYLDALMPPFTSAFNDYVRSELKFQSDRQYVALSDRANGAWNWGPGGLTGFLNVTDELAAAMKQSPAMKVLVARGYYDLDVPYFGTDYALNQLGLAPELRANVTRAFYESGHTLYTPRAGREKLKADVAVFITGLATARASNP